MRSAVHTCPAGGARELRLFTLREAQKSGFCPVLTSKKYIP